MYDQYIATCFKLINSSVLNIIDQPKYCGAGKGRTERKWKRACIQMKSMVPQHLHILLRVRRGHQQLEPPHHVQLFVGVGHDPLAQQDGHELLDEAQHIVLKPVRRSNPTKRINMQQTIT